MNNDINGDNFWAFENDSSNFAKEGEGVPEMIQRLQKEGKARQEKTVMQRIINYLIGGWGL